MKELTELGKKCGLFGEKLLPENAAVWLDLSALLHPGSEQLIKMLKKACLRRGVQLYLSRNYKDDWNLLHWESCGKIFSEKQAVISEKAWNLLTQVDTVCAYYPTPEKISMIVTGNRTEAERMILSCAPYQILLIEGEQICLLEQQNFESWCGMLEQIDMSRGMRKEIPANPVFQDKNGQVIDCQASGYDRNNNNLLYEERDGLLKLTGDLEKLDWMLKHRPDLEHFAWPVKTIYLKTENKKTPVGYGMKQWKNLIRMEEIFVREANDLMRLELALKLLKNVIYLHKNGILVTDYNLENFQLDQDGNLIMLDCMGYSVRQMCGQFYAPKEQYPGITVSYGLKSSYIRAEYQYLKAVVACILCGGRWPYDSSACCVLTQEDPESARKVLELETPWEIFSYLGTKYEEQSPKVRSGLVQLRNAAYVQNSSMKRRPVLLLVENSRYCKAYKKEMQECLNEMLRTLCQRDGVTASLTDLLIAGYSESITDLVFGIQGEAIQGADFLPARVLENKLGLEKEFPIYMGESGVRYSTVLDQMKKLLQDRKTWYLQEGQEAKLPTCIMLGSFQAEPRDESVHDTKAAVEELNAVFKETGWTLVKVKFGEESGSQVQELVFHQTVGEKYSYSGIQDAARVLDSLSYPSSLIMSRGLSGV